MQSHPNALLAQVAEVTELAASVTEILATDLAIPLARDVALPLIKASIKVCIGPETTTRTH